MLLLGDTPPSNGPSISVVSDNLTDGGAVVPGGWFYVKGADLADVTRLWAGSDFADPSTLPTDLNGVEVWVDGTPVPVCFISPGQVNAQAPANISGTINVQVVRLGIPSNVLTAPVSQIQPSVYYYRWARRPIQRRCLRTTRLWAIPSWCRGPGRLSRATLSSSMPQDWRPLNPEPRLRHPSRSQASLSPLGAPTLRWPTPGSLPTGSSR